MFDEALDIVAWNEYVEFSDIQQALEDDELMRQWDEIDDYNNA